MDTQYKKKAVREVWKKKDWNGKKEQKEKET